TGRPLPTPPGCPPDRLRRPAALVRGGYGPVRPQLTALQDPAPPGSASSPGVNQTSHASCTPDLRRTAPPFDRNAGGGPLRGAEGRRVQVGQADVEHDR